MDSEGGNRRKLYDDEDGSLSDEGGKRDSKSFLKANVNSKSALKPQNCKRGKSSTYHLQNTGKKQNNLAFRRATSTPRIVVKESTKTKKIPSQSLQMKKRNSSFLGNSVVHSFRSPILSTYLKDVHQKVKRSTISMIDLNVPATRDLSPLSQTSKEIALAPSHKLHFRNDFEPSYQQKYSSGQEFHLIRNSRLFDGLWTSPRDVKGTLTVVPSSEGTFAFKKRTCSFGPFPEDGVSPKSTTSEGNLVIEDLDYGFETDKSDESFPSTDSDAKSREDSFFSADTFTSPILEENGDIRDNLEHPISSVLVVNEPIQLQCTDQATGREAELLIYSEEYLEELSKKKGGEVSRRDILESVLKRRRIYEGKRLRVIFDSEKFLSDLNDVTLSLGETSTPSKNDHPNFRTPGNVTRRKRNVRSAPPVMKRREDDPKVSKWRNNFSKFHEESNIELSGLESVFKTDAGEPQKNVAEEGTSCDARFRRPKYIQVKALADNCNGSGDGKTSRMTLKRINVEEIIESNFRNFFHLYAKYGGRLQSGAAICKWNSHFWLKRCGIICDEASQRTADECFSAIARSKLVLNIRDYVLYLAAVARRRKLFLQDIVRRLTSVDTPHSPGHASKMPSSVVGAHLSSRKAAGAKQP